MLRLTHGRGADRVFEVAGIKGTFEQAWKLCRPSGTVILVALSGCSNSAAASDVQQKPDAFKTGGVHAALIETGQLDASCMITARPSAKR